jgi:predicted nucleic acid-binding protein
MPSAFLLDTNVISELRKGADADPGVAEWFAELDDREVFLSVLTIGELRRGVESIRRRDAGQAESLVAWLEQLRTLFADRLIAVDSEIAERWGRMSVPDPLPVIDGLLAATAEVRGLTLATRDTAPAERAGVAVVNPFAA